MYEIFNLGEPDRKSSLFQRLRNKFGKETQEKARMVLVEGSPGIGKTTFCLKIANDWARKTIPKKHDFPVFKLMLLLKCRDMDEDVMQAINDQLLAEDMTEKKKKDLMDYIRDEQNQDKILMILDGLDELPESAEPFVDKLLRRKVLSHCSVLATSRQEKGIEVRQRYDFDSLLQINGFTVGDASEYIRKHFKKVDAEDLSKGESLIQAIEENIFLHALRNNPLNLLLLCIVFEDFEGNLPTNRSELYQIIFRCLLRRFCSKNSMEVHHDDRALENQFEESTLVLGELAWRCLQEERPSFLEEELDKLEKMRTNGKGFPAVKLGFVFMEASVKKLNPRNEYHFLHKTFQEFLAAKYLALKILKEGITVFDYFKLDKRGITRKYREVFLFVAGILGKDGEMFFKQVGETLSKNWNWQPPEQEDCVFLTELLNESGAADEFAMVVWPCIPLPQSLEMSLRDGHILRFVRYSHEGDSRKRNLAPGHLTKLMLTEAHTLTEDSASDVHRILNNEAMKELFISTDEMTSLLASTLLKGLSASNLSLSSFTLKTFKGCSPDAAVTFGLSLSSCNLLSTVTLKLNEINDNWARAVDIGLSRSTQLKSVIFEFHGLLSSAAVQTLKLLLSNTSLISFSLIIFGNVEDCLASGLSEALLGDTALESLTVIAHGNLSNFGADSLVKGFQENRTLHSLAFKVFGGVPKHWRAMVDKIYALVANKTWKSLVLHPNVRGTFANPSNASKASLLKPILRENFAVKTLTINMWGKLSICNAEALENHLLKASPLSSLILNVHGKVSNGVADYLVKIFVAYKKRFFLTINVWGEITSYGRSSLRRLSTEGRMQFFVVNVHGLVTDDLVHIPSAWNVCSTSTAHSVDISSTDKTDWGSVLGCFLAKNKSLTTFSLSVYNYAVAREVRLRDLSLGLANNWSLTTFSLTVYNYADIGEDWLDDLSVGLLNNRSLTTFNLTIYNYVATREDWLRDLSIGLANNKLLTTFSLTVHNYANRRQGSEYGLGNALAKNKSLTTFSLTVYNYADAYICDVRKGWGYGLGDGLAENKSLTTFSLTVHNYADTRGVWEYGLGNGLANNMSLTTFSLTVHNYTNTGEVWLRDLSIGLAYNRILTTFILTFHNYADTRGNWGSVLGNGLANNKLLTTFNLTVHNYVDTTGDWLRDLSVGLAKNRSLTTFSLTVHNYTDTGGDWGHGLGKGLAESNSLTTFSLIVHNYADTRGDWGHGLGKGLAESKSLTSFRLTVYNYADTSEKWGHGLAEGLAKSDSLTTLRLAVNNHSNASRDHDYDFFQRFAEIKSLTSLSVSVSLYGEDIVHYNNSSKVETVV